MQSPEKAPVICWFRRDLRTRDNPALYHASVTGLPVIPLFVTDTELVAGTHADGAVFDFQAECLRDLSEGIDGLGGRLIVRGGKLFDVFAGIIHETHPVSVYFNRDYEPSAMNRDRAVTKYLTGLGIDVKTFEDVVIHPPGEIMAGSGKPYAVYTPFADKWRRHSKPKPRGKPARFVTPALVGEPVAGSIEIGRRTEIVSPAMLGGERHAVARWNSFMKDGLSSYAERRDRPGIQGTSMMSAYLRFGCISPVRMYWDILDARYSPGESKEDASGKYLSELIWREFYASSLYHFPFTADRNYREDLQAIDWTFDERVFRSWKEGRTGFPLVDAGMRQLNATGWMHNRVRMVVASFLTKDLFMDWRLGEEYFATKLLDSEKASNVGGWQWSASTGVDPRPLRIFNPTLQSRRFDNRGQYIRQWIPELRQVPYKFIHEPATMSPALQKDTGVSIGKDYPFPIVNHNEAALHFKRSYYEAKRKRRSRA